MSKLKHRNIIQPEQLVSSLTNSKNVQIGIKSKLSDDVQINEGMFILATAYFEDALREILKNILLCFPEKIKSSSLEISRMDLCDINNNGIGIVIEKELYSFFRKGISEQLVFILQITNRINPGKMDPDIQNLIDRCSDIYLYRNSLVHNGGIPNNNFDKNIRFYKLENTGHINYSYKTIGLFIDDHIEFFKLVIDGICETFSRYMRRTGVDQQEYNKGSRLDLLQKTWYSVFDSSLLHFEEYWIVNSEFDLVTGIKSPQYERGLSSGEEILLSMWRHQYYDGIKEREFLLCSIDKNDVYEIYDVLDKVKFYHMFQEAERLGIVDQNSIIQYIASIK